METKSSKYEKIKNFYVSGFWNDAMLEYAVNNKWLTEEEAEEIIKIKKNGE